MRNDQTISAEEFVNGAPADASSAPTAPARGRFTQSQYREYVRLVRDRNTTPDQLASWTEAQGFGRSTNAEQVLDFVRRNPRAQIPNVFLQQPRSPSAAASGEVNLPTGTSTDWLPDFIQGPVERLGVSMGLIDPSTYYGVGNYGPNARPRGPTVATNPALPTWTERVFRSIGETFSDAGSGINASILRSGDDIRDDEAIRSYGSSHNWTSAQIDAAVRDARAFRGRQIAETRSQRQIRDADEARREGNGWGPYLRRGSADLVGAIIGDANPSYVLAPPVRAGGALLERSAPVVGRVLERVGARGAVPVMERVAAASAPTAERMVGQSAVQGGINVATQGDEISHGLQENIDPAEVALHSFLGFALQGGAEALGAAAPRVARWVTGKREPGRIETPEELARTEDNLTTLEREGVDTAELNNVDEIDNAVARLVEAARTLDPEVKVPPEIDPLRREAAETPPRPEASIEESTPGETVAPEPSPSEDVVTRMTEALNNAGKATTEQQALYTQARRERLARLKAVADSTSGEAGFRAELAQLKGEMPRAEFEPVRPQFTQTDIDSLFNVIKENPTLLPFERINARTALSNMLDGKPPTPSEIGLLNEVFPTSFMKAVARRQARGQRISDFIANGVNVPRSLMSSVDLSAPLRQGVFLVGNKRFYQAWGPMFREFSHAFRQNNEVPAAARGKNWQSSGSLVLDEIRSRPTYDLMDQAGLAITGAHTGKGIANREEQFMSPWAERIPGVGRLVRSSEAAYTGFLNKLRADVFDDLVRLHRQAGINLEFEPTVLRDIARFINSATGRGDLHGKIGQAGPMLNGLFFSPRLIKSRFDMLNPVNYMTYSPIVRREAIKSLLSFGAIATTVLGLAAGAGLPVVTDPRSSDFGKIISGNTRYDILGGFSQYITLGARLITNETTTTTSQETRTLGEGFGAPTRLDVIERFFENKAAPVPSFLLDYFRGRDAIGEPFEPGSAVAQRFVPMFLQDLYDVVSDRGPAGFAMAIPGIFGVGVSTYTPPPNREGFMGGEVPTEGPPIAETPPQEPASEVTIQEFMKGAAPEEEQTPSAAPVPEQSTFENSIASDVLTDMGLTITDNGVRPHEVQRHYYETTQGAAPPGSSNHEIGNAIDIAVPDDSISVDDIVTALEEAGLRGVSIITRRHGTGPHWHISWEGVAE